MYLYLDDTHKMCNVKFAKLLGYNSPKEWADVQGTLEPFVEKESQETLAAAYWRAMEKSAASTINVTWKKKSDGNVKTNIILAPIAYMGHLFAVHFIEPIA